MQRTDDPASPAQDAQRAPTARGPLAGLTVVELGSMVSGPYCGKLLADLGADVIKVEPPGTGDPSRAHGPFPGDAPDPERSGLFLGLNTNKLGITLDIETPVGAEILGRLLDQADVLVANRPPRFFEQHGLSYERLKLRNERIIVCAITPFGLTGPYRDYKAANITHSAASGMSMGAGEPGRMPLHLPLEQCMFQAGLAAMAATTFALLGRRKSGAGRMIDVAEEEVMAVLHAGSNVLTYIFMGVSGLRQGRRGFYGLYPQTVLPCKDGWVVVSAPLIDQWIRFLELLGNPEWANNPRYRDRRKMQEEYPDEVDALIQPWFSARTKREIFEICVRHRIPFTPIFTAEEILAEPHLLEREFWAILEHPRAGALRYPGPPYRFSRTPWQLRTPAPTLGQHNALVYRGRLGYSAEQLRELCRAGVI